MSEFNSAVGGALLIGDRDETRLTQKVTLADGRDTQNVTTFQPQGNAARYAYLLLSGTVSAMGFVDEDPDVVKAELASVMASRRFKPVVVFGKEGLAPGTEANFARCLVSTRSAERSLTGVVGADAAFATDGSGILDGVSLHAVFGDTTPNLSEIQKLTFNNADPNAFRGVRAQGTTQVFGFGLGIDNAALAAGIAGLPAYNGRQVTVTGAALTGATFKSGQKGINYDGAVNVPQLEAVSGAIDSFIVNGGGNGNYSVNGGAAFTLPISEAAMQANQQAVNPNVVVKGASTGNSAAGQIDNFSGSGPAVSLNGVTVDFTAPDPKAKLQADYRASAAGRAGVVVGGAFSANGASTGVNIANGGVATASSFNSGNAAFGPAMAFDGDPSTRWAQDSLNAFPVWVTYDFGAGNSKIVSGYSFQGYTQDARTFVDYKFQGSNDNTTWTDLHSQTGVAVQSATHTFNNAKPYRYYRMLISKMNPDGGGATLYKLDMFGTQVSGVIQTGTFTYPASVGPQGALVVTGAGYAGNTTPPANPNASASFKFFYPLTATPTAPGVAGLGAIINRAPLGISPDIAASTTQQSTGADADFSYNLVTESGQGEWIDYASASPDGFALATSVIHAQGNGATLQITVETADADGAGNPIPSTIQTLHEFEPTGARGSQIVTGATAVKRLLRERHLVTGPGEFIFALALASR